MFCATPYVIMYLYNILDEYEPCSSCKLNLTWCRYIEAAFKLNNVQVLVRKTERLYGIETREY